MGQAFKRDLVKRYDLDLVPLLEDGVRVMLYNGARPWLSLQLLSLHYQVLLQRFCLCTAQSCGAAGSTRGRVGPNVLRLADCRAG